MSSSRSSTSVSSRSSSSRISDDAPAPKKKVKAQVSDGSRTPPRTRTAHLDDVRPAAPELTTESESVSSQNSSHEDTLGIVLGAAEEGPRSVALHLDALTKKLPVPSTGPVPAASIGYDNVRAALPGAAAYAGSFMMGRAAQFALTASGNPVGGAMAFATVAGLLHIGMEPIVGALRAKMGMRGDKDTKNYTNFVTALAIHVDSWIRNDEDGMKKAEKLARESLAPYVEGWDSQSGDMPPIWNRALTVLKAGARGFASNELPFYVFSAVYMLTNPAGLWVRSSVLAAHASKDIATVLELMMSVAGGAIAGIGTVGVQNAARTHIQGTKDAPLRESIKLARLNGHVLKVTRHQLELLKKALKDSLRAPAAEPADGVDISDIEDAVSEALRLTGAPDRQTIDAISAQLKLLPTKERQRLLAEVRVKVAKAAKPYTLSGAIATNYLEMVATRNQDGVFQADGGKIRRVVARSAANVAGLMAYGVALVHTINTIGQYGPAHVVPLTNTTDPEGLSAYPTTDAQAFGEMAALGPALITCWVGGRVLAPVAELVLAPITGALGRAGSAVTSAGSSAAGFISDYLAPAPTTNGPPQEDVPPQNGIDRV